MRTVPILATGIALALALGTATAVAATNEATVAATASPLVVDVAAAPEPAVAPAPVVVVEPVATSEPALTWSAPISQPAPEQTLAPGYEPPTHDQIPVDTGSDASDPGFGVQPDAHCSDVVPQGYTEAMWSERQLTLYGVVAPDSTYFTWIGYPADELQIMADHWLTNCTWANTSGSILHVDFGAGLEAADIGLLQGRVAATDWAAVTLSTGDVLHVDASDPSATFPQAQAWLLQGDRWMRIHMVNDTDPVAFAESLLASGLTW